MKKHVSLNLILKNTCINEQVIADFIKKEPVDFRMQSSEKISNEIQNNLFL